MVALPLLALDSQSDLYHCLSPWLIFHSFCIISEEVSLFLNFLQVITGYLLAGSIIGPGGLSFISEMVQVCFINVYAHIL